MTESPKENTWRKFFRLLILEAALISGIVIGDDCASDLRLKIQQKFFSANP